MHHNSWSYGKDLVLNNPVKPIIETDRLVLRPLERGDAKSLLTIFSDPEVMKYWNTPPWASIQDATDFIESAQADLDSEAAITLGILAKETEELMGKCMLFGHDKTSRRAEIGFGIGRRYWGKGFIQEAGLALIAYGFETLNIRRIEAEIDPHNTGSARALTRMGFTQEGLLRERWEIGGVVSDSALFGLLASDRGGR